MWRPFTSALLGLAAFCTPAEGNTHTHEWAVRFRKSERSYSQQAEDLAARLDMHNLGTVAGFEDIYSFVPRGSCQEADGVLCRARRDRTEPHVDIANHLSSHPEVEWAEQQRVLPRSRRHALPARDPEINFKDPDYPKQWHFHNPNENNVRVKAIWQQNITGRGVVVTVVDDGLEHNHPDLQRNYEPKASLDLNDDDPDPQPRYSPDNINKHGTRCAGEIAAEAGNDVCGVGIAYNAKVGGIRIIDGDVTDTMESRALGHQQQLIDIYSSSWGPDDDGRTVEGPGPLARSAIMRGIKQGRKGKGAIYVFAGGNGRRNDNCNCDGYTNSIYTLSIGAVDFQNQWPWYSEPCSATIAVTYSSGSEPNKNIVTTDLRQTCTDRHTGTSAAAPLAAGIFALLLEASPHLTWRDVQHLIIATSWKVADRDPSWQKNGIGKWISHQYGFGAIDTTKMVEASRTWNLVGPQHNFTTPLMMVNKEVRDYQAGATSVINVPSAGTVKHLEHVTINVTIEHQHRGDLEVFLTSPAGTVSQLLTQRFADDSSSGFKDWTFMTIFCWGEKPEGDWKIEAKDVTGNGRQGKLVRWQLTFFGTDYECKHEDMCEGWAAPTPPSPPPPPPTSAPPTTTTTTTTTPLPTTTTTITTAQPAPISESSSADATFVTQPTTPPPTTSEAPVIPTPPPAPAPAPASENPPPPPTTTATKAPTSTSVIEDLTGAKGEPQEAIDWQHSKPTMAITLGLALGCLICGVVGLVVWMARKYQPRGPPRDEADFRSLKDTSHDDHGDNGYFHELDHIERHHSEEIMSPTGGSVMQHSRMETGRSPQWGADAFDPHTDDDEPITDEEDLAELRS